MKKITMIAIGISATLFISTNSIAQSGNSRRMEKRDQSTQNDQYNQPRDQYNPNDQGGQRNDGYNRGNQNNGYGQGNDAYNRGSRNDAYGQRENEYNRGNRYDRDDNHYQNDRSFGNERRGRNYERYWANNRRNNCSFYRNERY